MRTGHFSETPEQWIALSDSPAVWSWTGALLVALALAPRFVGAYGLTLMVSALIAVVGAIALNILTGQTGLISLGQAGFLAVGAYANGILLVDYHVPVWLTIPAGGLAASLVSLLVGVPSLRLKGLYLAITTLAFSFIVNHVILYAESVTHGPNGVFVNGARLFGFDVQKGPPLYYLALAIALATLFAALNLSRTRIGRAWMAIRDHDIAARVMGIDLVRYKLLAFVISSFFVGVAGALTSLQLRFINVDVFALNLSIEALAMIIFGGLGSVAGASLGAVFLSFLPEALRLASVTLPETVATLIGDSIYEIRGIAYGVIIVVMLRFKPDGLIGLWRDARKYWSQWPLAY